MPIEEEFKINKNFYFERNYQIIREIRDNLNKNYPGESCNVFHIEDMPIKELQDSILEILGENNE